MPKTIFEKLGGKYEQQGAYVISYQPKKNVQ